MVKLDPVETKYFGVKKSNFIPNRYIGYGLAFKGEKLYFNKSKPFCYDHWKILALQYKGCGYNNDTIVNLIQQKYPYVIENRIINLIKYFEIY